MVFEVATDDFKKSRPNDPPTTYPLQAGIFYKNRSKISALSSRADILDRYFSGLPFKKPLEIDGTAKTNRFKTTSFFNSVSNKVNSESLA